MMSDENLWLLCCLHWDWDYLLFITTGWNSVSRVLGWSNLTLPSGPRYNCKPPESIKYCFETVVVKLRVQTLSRSTPDEYKVYWNSKTCSSLRAGVGDDSIITTPLYNFLGHQTTHSICRNSLALNRSKPFVKVSNDFTHRNKTSLKILTMTLVLFRLKRLLGKNSLKIDRNIKMYLLAQPYFQFEYPPSARW